MLLGKQTSVLAPIIVSLKVLLLLAFFWSLVKWEGWPNSLSWAYIAATGIIQFLFRQKYLAFAVYCAVLILSILAICITPFLKSWRIRVSFLIIFVLSFGFDQCIVDVTGVHLNMPMMRTIWVERSSEIYLNPYWMDISVNLLKTFIIGLVLALPAGRWSLANRWSFVPASALASVVFITVYTKGATKEFPPPLAVAGKVIVAAISTNSKAVAATVAYDETPSPLVQHIVYIVDESVRGDYIQLNNNNLSNTPFLAGLGRRLINFGIATSGANCSYSSRMMLRSGARQIDARHLEAGLFQYAQRAGFRTVVINAWKKMATYMDSSERSAIDIYLPVTDEPPYVRDNRVAEKLLEVLADDKPTFIYVEKFGVHFPYDLSYPSESEPPSRLASLVQAIMYLSRSQNFAMDANERDRLVKSYRKAITWSVDGFFQRLQPHLDLSRTLLLYTSDHGQTMWEDGYKTTHCSSSHPHPGESYVPLFALTEVPSLEGRFRQGAARGFNRASHFDIFPTLLLAMGFKEKWVSSKFGLNLFDLPSMRHRQFLIDADGAEWVTVD